LLDESSDVAASFDVWERLTDACRHYAEPVSRHELSISDRFAALAEEWRQETGALSSMSQIVLHPAYQQIVGMGHAALPLIVADLERRPDHWFWALRAITGVDPVPREDKGNLRRMADAWIGWARDSGLV
jgi:hypothetical protein